MHTAFKLLLKDKVIAICFWMSIVFFIVAIIFVVLAYPHLPPFLPLYNKLAWGYARLGRTYEIGIPILIPIVLFLLNIFLGKYVYEKSPLLTRFLFLISFLIALFTCIFIVKLTLIIL